MTRVERGRGREAPGSVLSSACQGAGRDEARGACAPWSWQGQPRGLPVFGLPAGATARGGLAWHLCLSDGPSRPVSPGLRAGRNAARPRLHPRPPLTATSSHPPTGHSPNIWLVFPASWGVGGPELGGARLREQCGRHPGAVGTRVSGGGAQPGAGGGGGGGGQRPGAGKPLQGARAAKSLPPDLRATLGPRWGPGHQRLPAPPPSHPSPEPYPLPGELTAVIPPHPASVSSSVKWGDPAGAAPRRGGLGRSGVQARPCPALPVSRARVRLRASAVIRRPLHLCGQGLPGTQQAEVPRGRGPSPVQGQRQLQLRLPGCG